PGELEFRSPDGKWSMAFKGRIQARVEDFDSENDTQSGTNFSVPKVRLTFSGKAGADNVHYKVSIDAATNDKQSSPAEDKRILLKDAWIDWGFPWGNALRFGQFRFPFGRETLPSGGMSLTSSSIATKEFAPGREPGAMVHDKLAHDHFEYYAAV